MSKDIQLPITEKSSAIKFYHQLKIEAMESWFKRTGKVSGFFADKQSAEYQKYKIASEEIDKFYRR